MKVFLLLVITIIGIQAGFIDDLYKEHNRYRRQYGLPSLKVDKTIEYYLKKLRSVSYSVGHNHAQSQNLKDYNRLCTGYIGIRENIYWGYKLDARKVMDAWKRSSGHNRNLLTANSRYIGCDFTYGGNYPYAVVCAFLTEKTRCY